MAGKKHHLHMLLKHPLKYFLVIIKKIFSKLFYRFALTIQNILLTLRMSLPSKPRKALLKISCVGLVLIWRLIELDKGDY